MSIICWEIEAHRFVRQMESGRTRPVLCACNGCCIETELSTGNRLSASSIEDEFIVKICGCEDMTTRARLCEYVAAIFGQAMSVSIVEPAIVTIPPALVSAFPPEKQSALGKQPCQQYGCKHLGPGWIPYVDGKVLESDLVEPALGIYIFDVLIQNPDRRRANPNVLTNGTEVRAYDHDMAFSFLLPVFGEKWEPWQVRQLEFLKQHIFFNSLKGKKLDIEPYIERIRALDGDIMSTLRAIVPLKWVTDDLDKIVDHIFAIRQHAGKFADEIIEVLS